MRIEQSMSRDDDSRHFVAPRGASRSLAASHIGRGAGASPNVETGKTNVGPKLNATFASWCSPTLPCV
jgi:hypothetical protein